MNDAHRAAIIKQVRRAVLDSLNMVYPTPFSFESLSDALLHLDVDDGLLWKDVSYLDAKGYIECANAADKPPRAKRVYRLTPTGNEIANRLRTDAALTP